jgi:hypothetical protein
MRQLRISRARALFALTIAVATAVVAGVAASAAAAGTGTCTSEGWVARQNALDAYVAAMPSARKAHFRSHRSAAARKAFVKRQQARLKSLKRAAACSYPSSEPEATPPAPTPSFQPGHYVGRTSQNENFAIDVNSTGTGVSGLFIEQINESCTPQFNIYGNTTNWGAYTVPLAPDGSFKFDWAYQGTIGGSYPSSNHLTVSGRLSSGGVAVGNLVLATSFTGYGKTFSCNSGQQSWTAARAS